MVTALLMINGKASVSFHTPAFVSPTTCPILRTVALAPKLSTAAWTIRSPTNFEAAYPVCETCSGDWIGASGIRAGAGVPSAAEMELQKMSLAGVERVLESDS